MLLEQTGRTRRLEVILVIVDRSLIKIETKFHFVRNVTLTLENNYNNAQ